MTHYTSTDDIDLGEVVVEAFFDIETDWGYDEAGRQIADVSAKLSHVNLGNLEIKPADAVKAFGSTMIEAWEDHEAGRFDPWAAPTDDRDERGDAACHAKQDAMIGRAA